MKLFERVLIANRGEIAVRIMRTCRDLGIGTVAIYGADEPNAPHIHYADDAFRLETEAPIPYLDIDAILDVAKRSGASAIHPGYGFLAENAEFARRCEDQRVTFVGPPAEAIAAMGDKIRAREIAGAADVPLVPGSDDAVAPGDVAEFANRIGYPVALKAAAGGGGRGFRVAFDESEIGAAIEGASGEAERYFGDGRVFVERYLEQPRHIEIQVLADRHGNAVALGERDCSIQRRHQKLIEEAPSPALSDQLRREMERAAVSLARAVDYVGAGTVEFMVQGDEFYFLEMNTRIQVEHPVTELITGTDLVAEQLRIAAGCEIGVDRYPHRYGHAIECRINAEDVPAGFQPVSGTVTSARLPEGPGVRLDGVIASGVEVSPRYDSMLGKLIVWAPDRDAAIGRMRRALRELSIDGLATTAGFHDRVMEHPVFQSGDYDTRFLERHPEVTSGEEGHAAAAPSGSEPAVEPVSYQIEVNGRRFDVRVYQQPKAKRTPPKLLESGGPSAITPDGTETIISPIQGTVLSVAVEQGDTVRAGDVICVVEAMKMENEISAGRDGHVVRLDVVPGKPVESGAVIAVIESGDHDGE